MNISLHEIQQWASRLGHVNNRAEYEQMLQNKEKHVTLVLYGHNAGTMSIFNKLMNYLHHYPHVENIQLKYIHKDRNVLKDILEEYTSDYKGDTTRIDMRNYISYEQTGTHANLIYLSDPSWRKIFNNLFTKYIRFSPSFIHDFEPYQESINTIRTKNKKVIGMLIRHPALSHEQIRGRMPSYNQYDDKIKSLLEKYDNKCAFILCTDVLEAEQYFKQKYSSYDIIHPYSMKSSQKSRDEAHTICDDKCEITKIAFLTVLLLSKCDDFIFPNSNMASVVLYMNPNIEAHFLIG